jgi:threonine synthase
MSRCLAEFLNDSDKKVTVLVATSGDTGGAVAQGFYGAEGIEVVILYPSGMVSEVQERQLTTLGKNITALEVKGNFDDCQRLVKQAFSDPDLKLKRLLTSANSINIARWLPQQFYYFLGYKQWPHKPDAPVVSVPSGNFGNICAGMLACASGLPVKHFIAACNANDTIPRFLETSVYEPHTTVPTFSSAMDVADPSNFIRILEMVEHNLPTLREQLSSVSFSDVQTLDAVKDIYDKYQYTPDPHGAVSYLALEQYLQIHPGSKGYFLETAHPVKFPQAIRQATGKQVPIPDALKPLMERPMKRILLENDYEHLRAILL